jgi:hypothetical protein
MGIRDVSPRCITGWSVWRYAASLEGVGRDMPVVIKDAVPTDPQALSIALVQNWTEELKRLVPTK